MSEPQTEAGKALWEAYGGTTASAAIQAIEAEAITTFLQSEQAKSLLAEALHERDETCWGVDTGGEKPTRDCSPPMHQRQAKAILASLLEEMKK